VKLGQVRAKIQQLKKLERTLVLDLRKCNRELQDTKKRGPKDCPVLRSSEGRRKKVSC
jgi:hypothetical protein